MAIVELRIELPTYARSFTIQVPDTCTILEVKQEISHSCPGQPRVEGQKLIWRGRFLADEEKVEAIWKSPDEPRILHLSVHPSAWTTGSPIVLAPPSPTASTLRQPIPTRTVSQPLASMPIPSQSLPTRGTPQQLSFVVAKHQEALTALIEGRANPAGLNAMTRMREEAVNILQYNGCSWPSILDEPYPVPTPGGLEYVRVDIGGIPYLSLKNPNTLATDFQMHALKVLTYTFSILSKDYPQNVSPSPTFTVSQTAPGHDTAANVPHLNELLQQMGLPPLNAPNVNVAPLHRNQQAQAARPDPLQDIQLRPFLTSLLMVLVRTSLLLYFVAPARKPIFGLLIMIWIVYEVWRPFRDHIARPLEEFERRMHAHNGQQQNPARRQNGEGGAERVAPVPPPAENNNARNRRRMQAGVLVEMLGNMNIEREQEIFSTATRDNPMEPSLGHRITTFFGLLVSTLHPAVWNQRRVALRRREGVVRNDVSMRETRPRTDLEDEEARRNEERAEEARQTLRALHERRAEWIQRYMRRVVSAEWVDDAD